MSPATLSAVRGRLERPPMQHGHSPDPQLFPPFLIHFSFVSRLWPRLSVPCAGLADIRATTYDTRGSGSRSWWHRWACRVDGRGCPAPERAVDTPNAGGSCAGWRTSVNTSLAVGHDRWVRGNFDRRPGIASLLIPFCRGVAKCNTGLVPSRVGRQKGCPVSGHPGQAGAQSPFLTHLVGAERRDFRRKNERPINSGANSCGIDINGAR